MSGADHPATREALGAALGPNAAAGAGAAAITPSVQSVRCILPGMTKAVAFIASAQPARALAFYRDVLGLRLLEDHPFALVFDAFGTTLRVQKAERVVLAPYTAFGLQVEDIRAHVGALAARGVEAVRYPHFDQDELGIWRAPQGARVFWFHDPDGNLLSLEQQAE